MKGIVQFKITDNTQTLTDSTYNEGELRNKYLKQGALELEKLITSIFLYGMMQIQLKRV